MFIVINDFPIKNSHGFFCGTKATKFLVKSPIFPGEITIFPHGSQVGALSCATLGLGFTEAGEAGEAAGRSRWDDT